MYTCTRVCVYANTRVCAYAYRYMRLCEYACTCVRVIPNVRICVNACITQTRTRIDMSGPAQQLKIIKIELQRRLKLKWAKPPKLMNFSRNSLNFKVPGSTKKKLRYRSSPHECLYLCSPTSLRMGFQSWLSRSDKLGSDAG